MTHNADRNPSVPSDPPEGGTVSDAAGRLSRDVASLVQEELGRAKQEFVVTARRAGLGGAALTAGGVCAVLALLSAHQTLLRYAERVLPPHHASTVLTAGYASGAAGLAWYGYGKLRQAQQTSQEALDRVAADEQPRAWPES